MDTLVLSPTYELINQVTWHDAISLLFRGRVEVVTEYTDWTVRSVTRAYKVPAVIRFLKGAAGWRRHGARFSRDNVYARDKGCCQYCGVRLARHEATFEHVMPRAKGGTTRWENIVIACLPCNQRKRDRTPAEAGMKLRTKPVRPLSAMGRMAVSLPASGKMPAEWQDYLRSVSYWNTTLDEG
ncbi:HNH endonuclease-like protein [Virus Rctr197k]|nr:HNH endonuclease-like protein [Virus Rctr197k]